MIESKFWFQNEAKSSLDNFGEPDHFFLVVLGERYAAPQRYSPLSFTFREITLENQKVNAKKRVLLSCRVKF